jgi:hypothetical protein
MISENSQEEISKIRQLLKFLFPKEPGKLNLTKEIPGGRFLRIRPEGNNRRRAAKKRLTRKARLIYNMLYHILG